MTPRPQKKKNMRYTLQVKRSKERRRSCVLVHTVGREVACNVQYSLSGMHYECPYPFIRWLLLNSNHFGSFDIHSHCEWVACETDDIYIFIYGGGHITPEFSVGYGVNWTLALWILDCSPIRYLNIMWKWQNRPLFCTSTQTHTDKIQYRILFPKSNLEFLAFQFLILIFNRCLEELYYWVYCIYFTCIRNRCHCKKKWYCFAQKVRFYSFLFLWSWLEFINAFPVLKEVVCFLCFVFLGSFLFSHSFSFSSPKGCIWDTKMYTLPLILKDSRYFIILNVSSVLICRAVAN